MVALIVGPNVHRDHVRSIRDGDRVPMNLSGSLVPSVPTRKDRKDCQQPPENGV